jgi:hypothetical protein
MMKVVTRRNWLERIFKPRCLDQRIKTATKTTFWEYKKYATQRKNAIQNEYANPKMCTKFDLVSTLKKCTKPDPDSAPKMCTKLDPVFAPKMSTKLDPVSTLKCVQNLISFPSLKTLCFFAFSHLTVSQVVFRALIYLYTHRKKSLIISL